MKHVLILVALCLIPLFAVSQPLKSLSDTSLNERNKIELNSQKLILFSPFSPAILLMITLTTHFKDGLLKHPALRFYLRPFCPEVVR